MNILKITASDNSTGGASRVAMDLANGLRIKGYTINIFSGTKTSTDPRIRKISKTKVHSAISHLLANDIEYFATDYLLTTPEFTKADIIQAHNVHGWYFNLGTLGKMSQEKPVVWTLHDMWAITPHCAHSSQSTATDGFFTCDSRADYPSLYWSNEVHLQQVKKRIYETARLHLVVPCQWLANKISQSILKDTPCTVIYNGIDTTRFIPSDQAVAREKLNLPKDKTIILFVANGGITNQFKGGDEVLTLAKNYSFDTTITFVCVGGPSDTIEENIVYRKGVTDKDILALYYAAADVFLFPSRHETFPLVVLEALAVGLPVVGFTVGGVPEAVTHRAHGYLTEPGNTAGLKEGIEYIRALNPVVRENLKQTCSTHVQNNFSIENMVNKYQDLYTYLLTKKT